MAIPYFARINFHPNSTKGNNVIYKSYFCSNARNAWWTFVNFTAVTRSTKLWNLKNVKETLLFLGIRISCISSPFINCPSSWNLTWCKSKVMRIVYLIKFMSVFYYLSWHLLIFKSSHVILHIIWIHKLLSGFNTLNIHFCILF